MNLLVSIYKLIIVIIKSFYGLFEGAIKELSFALLMIFIVTTPLMIFFTAKDHNLYANTILIPFYIVILMLGAFFITKRRLKNPTGNLEQATQYVTQNPDTHGFSKRDIAHERIAFRVNSATHFKIMHYASYGIGWGALMMLIVAFMKTHYFLLLMTSCGLSNREVDQSMLNKRMYEGHECVFVINEQEPYSGLVHTYYDNVLIQKTDSYKEGVLDGICIEYSENGQIKAKGEFVDGKPHGKIESYYDNGQLESKGGYVDGKLRGKYEKYYKNGQLQVKTVFMDDKEHGKFEEYYENGQIKLKGEFVDGKPHGKYERYYENGQLEAKGEYVNGQWIWGVDGYGRAL